MSACVHTHVCVHALGGNERAVRLMIGQNISPKAEDKLEGNSSGELEEESGRQASRRPAHDKQEHSLGARGYSAIITHPGILKYSLTI